MSVQVINTTAKIVKQIVSLPTANVTKKSKKTLLPSLTQTGNPSQSLTQILDSTMDSLPVLELLLLETFSLVKMRLLIQFGQVLLLTK